MRRIIPDTSPDTACAMSGRAMSTWRFLSALPAKTTALIVNITAGWAGGLYDLLELKPDLSWRLKSRLWAFGQPLAFAGGEETGRCARRFPGAQRLQTRFHPPARTCRFHCKSSLSPPNPLHFGGGACLAKRESVLRRREQQSDSRPPNVYRERMKLRGTIRCHQPNSPGSQASAFVRGAR